MSPSNLPAPLRDGRTRMRNKLPRSMFWQGRLDLTKDPFLSRWPSFSGRGRVPCRWPPPPPISYSSSEPRGLSLLPDFPFWYHMAKISSEFRRTPVTVSLCYLRLEFPARFVPWDVFSVEIFWWRKVARHSRQYMFLLCKVPNVGACVPLLRN